MIHRTAACWLYCTAFPHESDLALDRTTRSMVVVGCNNFVIAGLQTPQLPCLMFDRDVTPIRRSFSAGTRLARRGLPRTGAGFFRTRVGRAPSAAPHDAIPFVTTGPVVPSALRKPASPRCAPQVPKPGAVGRGLLSLAPTLAAPPPGPAFSPFRNHVRRVPTSSPPNVVSAVGSVSVSGRVAYPPKWNSSSDPVPPMA